MTRMTAAERREQILVAASRLFAAGGYAGTSTEAIADAAGISQAYLFRLFSTKRALFVAVIEEGFQRVGRAFAEVVGDLTGEEALKAMGLAYGKLLVDRELLQLQMHAYAACDDPQIRDATRRAFTTLWEKVAALAALPSEEIGDFFAHGMLLNVIAALDATELGEPWVRTCLGVPDS